MHISGPHFPYPLSGSPPTPPWAIPACKTQEIFCSGRAAAFISRRVPKRARDQPIEQVGRPASILRFWAAE